MIKTYLLNVEKVSDAEGNRSTGHRRAVFYRRHVRNVGPHSKCNRLHLQERTQIHITGFTCKKQARYIQPALLARYKPDTTDIQLASLARKKSDTINRLRLQEKSQIGLHPPGFACKPVTINATLRHCAVSSFYHHRQYRT